MDKCSKILKEIENLELPPKLQFAKEISYHKKKIYRKGIF